MQRTMMKSKIHRATVTGANVDYVGSITLDPELMRLADVREFEQVHVLDIDNGARFETYAMAGGPGDVILNGAAARLVQPGDRVIVITYASYDDAELDSVRAAHRARRRVQSADPDRRGRGAVGLEPRLDAHDRARSQPARPARRLTCVRRSRSRERRRRSHDRAPGRTRKA